MEVDIAMTDTAGERISSPLEGEPETAHPTEEHLNRPEFSLPQADGGRDAWLFLAACFVIEALVWGRCFSLDFPAFIYQLRIWEQTPGPHALCFICNFNYVMGLFIVLIRFLFRISFLLWYFPGVL
jgi:hypothetical protein